MAASKLSPWFALASFVLTAAMMQPGAAMLAVLPINAALLAAAVWLARREGRNPRRAPPTTLSTE